MNEATRRWQAESLAKRLLEEDDYTSIAAAAFDLNCQQEFEEAIATISTSKDRQIKRACADGFAEFAGQVDAALENAPKVEKARQVMLSTAQAMRAALQAKQTQEDALKNAEKLLNETTAQKNEVDMCIRWVNQRKQIEELDEQKNYPEALNLLGSLLEEIRLFPSSHFAKSLSTELSRLQIKQKCDQELNQWMVHAMDRGRELGFSKLSRDVGYAKRTSKSKDDQSSRGESFIIDKMAVERFFAIHRKDYADEQYSNHRLPALKQTIAALSRATTASALPEERAVRFRNSLAEICGFFMIEQLVGALSKGEMAEVWAECSSKLLESLQTGFPKAGSGEKLDEIAETIACDVARTCLWVGFDAPDLKDFFQARIEQIKEGWTVRSLSLVRDYCQSSFNKRADVDDHMLPFCLKAKQEMTRALIDASVLERFLGSFKLGLGNNNEQSFERGCIDRALRGVLDADEMNLDDALFVYRAARELGSESPQSKESFFETETAARERIENLFVSSKVDRLIKFEYPQDFLPILNATTKLEPHACVSRMLQEVERAFSQDPMISTGEMNHIPREVRSSLLAETMGRLADVLEKWIIRDSQHLNPLSIKLFSLDLLAIEQYFPDHSERFAHLIGVLQPFCTEGALELALLEASHTDKERFATIFTKFKELDSSSRLFGPPALKKKIVDLREHEAKRYLNQLKVKPL